MHERSAANMSAEKSLSCLVIRIYGCLKEKVFLFLRWHPAISQQSSCCKQIFFQWEDKKSATKHILYSIHVCPFKRWPLQRRCAMRPLSQRDAPTKVDLLFHGGLNTPGSQGASYVSINHSLACLPCRRCHAGSVLRKAGHS